MHPPRLPETSPIAIAARSILETLGELRAVEYKGQCSFDDIEPHIIKTAMAMANLRGGGYIIIGVGRVGDFLQATGVDASLLPSYDADRVFGAIAKYAEPAVDANIGILGYADKEFVVIAVNEFERTPVICRRGSEWVNLKERITPGSIFIRPRGVMETRTPRTSAEVNEVLELATEKRAIYLLSQTRRLSSLFDVGTSEKQYLDELGEAAAL